MSRKSLRYLTLALAVSGAAALPASAFAATTPDTQQPTCAQNAQQVQNLSAAVNNIMTALTANQADPSNMSQTGGDVFKAILAAQTAGCQPTSPATPGQATSPNTPSQVDLPNTPSQVDLPNTPSQVNLPNTPSQVNTPNTPSQVNTPSVPWQVNSPDTPSRVNTPNTPSQVDTPPAVGMHPMAPRDVAPCDNDMAQFQSAARNTLAAGMSDPAAAMKAASDVSAAVAAINTDKCLPVALPTGQAPGGQPLQASRYVRPVS